MEKNFYQFLRVCFVLTFFGFSVQAQELSIKDISVNEDAGVATFSVYLSAPSSNVITVDYATGDNAAVAGSDYTASNGTLTFPANSTAPRTIKVSISDDFDWENQETFYISLSNAVNASIANATSYCRINDNDGRFDISSSITVDENVGTANLMVSLNYAVPYEVKVDYNTANGNAVAGEDYTEKSGTLVFPPNSTLPQFISINISDESVYDPGEYFVVNLTNPQKASLGNAITYVYITDNEIQLNAGPSITVGESAGNAVFTISLPHAVPYEVKVDYNTVDGSATTPGDYTATSGTVIFPANSNAPQTIVVPINDDSEFDPGEYFYVELKNAQNASLGNTIMYGYITDNDITVNFGAFQSAYEGAGPAVFTVSLSAPSAQEVKVDYATSDGSATAPDDYTATSGTLTFPAGTTGPLSISVPIVDDNILDDYETININLSNAVNANIGSGSSYTYIIDNDTQINVSAPLAVSENKGTLSFNVYLATPVDHEVRVDYSTQDGSATTPGDYAAKSGTITFPANSTAPQTVQVQINDDTEFESNEYVYLTLSNPVGGSIGTGTREGYILNDDAQINISESISVSESDGAANFLVSLSNPVDHEVTVNYSTNNNNATAPGDYTATSGTITFPANSTAPKAISIPVIDDMTYDPGEYFYLTLSNPVGASLNNTQSSVEIIDNDTQINMLSGFTVKENVGAARFTAYLTSPVPYEVRVNYSTSNSSATAPSDFNAKSGTLVFPANSIAPVTFTVDIKSDAVSEADEEFFVTLSNPVNAAISNNRQYCTITEQEATLPTVEIIGNTAVAENAGTLSVTVSLSGTSSQPVTVNYHTTSISAQDGGDFTGTSGTVTFPANTSAPQTITIPILDDYEVDPNEYFITELSDATNATIGNATLYAYIIDNDALVNLDQTQVAVSEKDGTATFVARLSRKVPYEVTVNYYTVASGSTEGEDYSATSGTLTFPPNSADPQMITVPILDDQIFEGNEAFYVVLDNVVNAGIGNASVYAVIQDDDGYLSFEPSSVYISEGAGVATFTVQLSQPLPQEVTVNYTTSDNGAIAGSDYTATSGTLTFPANSVVPQTFTVPIMNDTESESQEQFLVTLSDPVNASLGNSTAYAVINDNDASLYIDPNSINVSESAGTATFTVTISRAVTDVVTVDYATADQSAVDGQDYTAVSGTLTFPANSSAPQTVTVSILNDLAFEYGESFTLNLSNPVNASVIYGTGYANINDDDATISIDQSSLTVSEVAGTATLTVTLSQPIPVPVTVKYATQSQNALADEDFSSKTGTITFPANSLAPVSISIPIIDDKFYDPGEVFSVQLSNATNASINSGTSYIYITDNDAIVNIEPTAFGSEENGVAVFTATITQAVPYEVKVDYSTIDVGGSTAGSDYSTSSGTIIFPANSNLPQTFSIPIIDDQVYDPNEILYVELSNAQNASIQNTQGYAYINDNDPKISLNPAVVTIGENGGTARFTVTLSEPVPFDVTVNYSTADGTATEGSDYTAGDGTVYFPANSTEPQTIAIPILDNSENEPDETFTITLSGANGAYLDNITATATIIDNDLSPVIATCVANQEFNTDKDVCTYTVKNNSLNPTVTENCGDPADITFRFTLSGATNSTADQYASLNTVTFNKGVTTVSVKARDACGNESQACTFTVTVSDKQAPLIPVLGEIAAVCSVTPAAPTTTDNCAGTITGTTTTVFPITKMGITIVTWTFDDGYGNVATADQKVIVSGNNEIATTEGTTVMTVGTNDNYAYDDNCQLVTRIVPNSLEGEVTVSVWIESENVPGPYVQRHYEITPAQNPEKASATVTLYFTQAEFDMLNTAVTYKLPTGPNDKVGKANLRIVKFPGKSTDGNGLAYSGTSSVIDPVDSDIIFVNGRWEVSFGVTGFSGFFVKADETGLPVTLVSFSGKKTAEKENTLDWATVDEVAFKGFEIQRSADAKHFETIGWVSAQATAKGILKTYQFVDKQSGEAASYYRLNMVDLDGTSVFSKIINIDNAPEKAVVSPLYPNPSVTREVYVDVIAVKAGDWTLTTYDLSGRILRAEIRKLVKGINKVAVQTGDLPTGSSLIRIEDQNHEVYIRKITRQ